MPAGEPLGAPARATFTHGRRGAVLEETGLPPDRLRVEITEKALEGTEAAAAALTRLRAMGIGVHLDDFGTGATSSPSSTASPSTRSSWPLVALLAGGPGARPGAVDLRRGPARSLSVVAEGVETPAQLEALLAYGCDEAQGSCSSRP